MTFLPIQLPPGIVKGANPDDVPGRWYDGSLVRWREGIMEPIGGWSKATSTAFTTTPRKIHQWRTSTNLLMTMVGTDAELWSQESSTFYNVAPSGLVSMVTTGGGGYGQSTYGSGTYGTARSGSTSIAATTQAWSFSNWGEDLLAVLSADGRLLYYTSLTATTAAKVVGVYSISTISRTSNVSTIVTSTPHNLTTGDLVQVNGVTSTSFNTTSASVTVTNSTTFTYANTGTDGSSSGGTVRDISVPISNRAVIVTPERHVVLLGAGGNARRVAWSSREDYTDWNFSSITNTAGFLDLSSETPLMSATSVREGTLIWSQNRAFLMRYVGQPYIYGVDELGSSELMAPNAYAEFNGMAAWMETSGFSTYQGGVIRPLPCPLNDYVFSDIDPVYGPRVSHAVSNGKFNEVWFFYPSNGATECDRYVMWNSTENWWSMGSLSRTAGFPAGVGLYPLMTGSDKHLYQHEYGWSYSGFNAADNIYVTSSTINISDSEQAMHITRLLPSNGGPVGLTKYTLYTRMTPGGDERTFGPYMSRSNGYVDTRAVGRDVRLRVAATDAGDWSIGRVRMQVEAGGKR